jgi:DNA-binding transcriptional MocR family regulator
MSRPLISVSARSLALLLPTLTHAPGPVYAALADSVTALVRDGRIAPETRLPSERELANELNLSRATVTAAYDQPARGRSQHQSGPLADDAQRQ